MKGQFRPWLQIEYALALAVLAGGIYSIWHLLSQGYLPQPFFYYPFDVWMDWFNTAFWSHNPGTYDTWRTLYPPVSFIFMKFLTLPSCYVANEGLYSRDCDWYGLITMHGWYVLNVFLIAKTFIKLDRATALPRSFAVAAGLPMLDGLERGNLIMICFTFFLLAHGPLLKSARLRWIALGLTINLKVYLIGTIFAYPIRRRWRWFEGALLATIGVYLVSWGLLGMGTPLEIYGNLTNWSDQLQQVSNLLDIWYTTAFGPIMSLLEGSLFPIVLTVGSWRVETFTLAIPLALHFVQFMIVAACAAAWLRPEAVPTHRLVNLTTAIAIITSEGGGYTQALLVFLTLFEPFTGFGRRYAIIACYVLSIPYDIYIDPVYPQINNGFLNTGPIITAYWLTYGPFLRPAVVLTIPLALACVTIADVWRDIARQGWRERWRFRRDAPIMVGEGRALPPAAMPA